jgi:mannosyltransferase
VSLRYGLAPEYRGAWNVTVKWRILVEGYTVMSPALQWRRDGRVRFSKLGPLLNLGDTLTVLDADDQLKSPGPAPDYRRQAILLIAIVVIASVMRLYHLDESSLWYDEVVTMKLARTASPAELCRLLRQIDATRAPLHPLLLQSWVALLGHSDASGRAFSVLCGIITIGLVYWIGLLAFDMTTGLWASWLCAISPLLVYYSREARMYMWLVLVTCLAWGVLFSFILSPKPWKLALYALSLVAIIYSHPLGMFMVCALGLASGLFRRSFRISWRGWLYTHFAVLIAVAPWLRQYLDHAPESTTGPLPLRFLLGMPIGFIGGNFTILLVCSLLIVYGLCTVHRHKSGGIPIALKRPVPSISLLIWLAVPPVLLYAYSRAAHPIFGPPRYTLFVGPAYLVLMARGLGKLPWFLGITTAAGGAIFSGAMLLNDVYRPDLKADWKGVAAYINQRDPGAVVAVISADLSSYTELETARYYFGPDRVVIPWSSEPGDSMSRHGSIWVSIGLRDGQLIGELPAAFTNDNLIREVVDFSKLRLMRVDF